MKSKPPVWIFLSLFLIAAPSRLRAQQPASAALSPQGMQEERAKVLMAEKRYDVAIQAYKDLLKSDPKNAVWS